MKKLFIIVFFMFFSFDFYSQNISKGLLTEVTPIITALPGLTASGAETFRFGSGLVTQSDTGNAFTFETDKRWFSLGKLNVGVAGSATERILYGLRLQRSGQGLTMGYGTLATTPNAASNPFIEWIGNSLLSPSVDAGNLEFYTTNNPGGPSGPGIRKLSFTLRSDLTALLGEVSSIPPPTSSSIKPPRLPKLEVNSLAQPGILVNVSTSNQLETYGLKSSIVNPNTASSNYGILSLVSSNSSATTINCGIFATSSGTQSNVATVTGPSGQPLGNYAGYFGGTVYATQGLFGSDKRLKKDIKAEESSLEKLKNILPVTYKFDTKEDGLKLNLPSELQHGFVAQDLEQIYPELVVNVLHPQFNERNEQMGTKTLKAVNYIGMISVLTSSIKELNEVVIKDLKDEIQLLKEALVAKENGSFKPLNTTINTNEFYLGQNTPNPYSTSTIIEYRLPNTEKNASIIVFDLTGKKIKEFKLNNTKDSIEINQGELQKGMYIYSLISNNSEITSKKIIVN